MKYLWQNYNEKNQYYISKKIEEPYSEVQREIEKQGEKYVEINPIFRFDDIFEGFIKCKNEIDEDLRETLENIIFHFLAQLDLKSGTTDFSVEEYFIERDILDEFYGKDIKEKYSLLTKTEKVKIVSLLRKKRETNNKRSFFYEAVKKIFFYVRLYYYKYEKKFLLYIQAEDTDKNIDKFSLLKDLFFDVTDEIEVFWGCHFGIIGRKETMCMDKMIIY